MTSCVFRKTICSYSRGCIYVAQLLLQSCFWCDQPVTTRIKLERTKMTQIKGQHVDITCMDFNWASSLHKPQWQPSTYTHLSPLQASYLYSTVCRKMSHRQTMVLLLCVYTILYMIWSMARPGHCCALSQKYLWHLVILIVWCPRPLAHSAVSA